MSLNFTVQKVEEGLPDGEYVARIDNKEFVSGDEKQGDYAIVKWTFLNPDSFEGQTFIKKYFVNHENPITKRIAIQEYSKFCIEIGCMKEGDQPKEDDFLYKVAILYLRKNKNGYTNIVGHKLVENNQKTAPQIPPKDSSQIPPKDSYDPEKTAAILALAGIQMPTTPVASGQPLNDEVPF